MWTEIDRDVLRVSGDDAFTYLQGQVSQDLRGLADGESAYSFVLQPAGKVDALIRIQRISATEFLIDTDPGFGDGVAARLNRFKIRVKVDVERLDRRAIAVRGADTTPAGAVGAWGRDDAYDVIGESVEAPANAEHGDAAWYEGERIAAGWPVMGREITDATIPAESGVVPFAVNFTKGCYPGQELVERMDSRASTAPRFVRRVRVDAAVGAGDEVLHDGQHVGVVTSAATTDAGAVALAVIARSAKPGDAVTVGATTGVIEALRDEAAP